jgi:hypothetical protein
MTVKIGNKQKYFKLPRSEIEIPIFRECPNHHFTWVRGKKKTYWDEHCIVCGERFEKM